MCLVSGINYLDIVLAVIAFSSDKVQPLVFYIVVALR